LVASSDTGERFLVASDVSGERNFEAAKVVGHLVGRKNQK